MVAILCRRRPCICISFFCPLISYVLTLPVFWSLRGVNVVADFVKEHSTQPAGKHKLESEHPSWGAT